jgi:hypothetical protein
MTAPPVTPTENQLRDTLVELLNNGCGTALHALLPPAGPTLPGITVPGRWQGERTIDRDRWRVDAVGYTAADTPVVVLEAKIDARLLPGQAWGYARWQQDHLDDEPAGVLAFIVPERRRTEVLNAVETDLRDCPAKEDVRYTHDGDGRSTITGPPDVTIVVLSWDEILNAIWTHAAGIGDAALTDAVERLWDACGRCRAAPVRALSASELAAAPDADTYLVNAVEDLIAHAAVIIGETGYRANPACAGFRFGFRYLGDGAPCFAVGIRDTASEAGIWVRAHRTMPGADHLTRAAAADIPDPAYIWIPIPLTPRDPTAIPTLHDAAGRIARLLMRARRTPS